MLNAMVFSFIWGIGAQIDETTRPNFDNFFQEIITGEDVNAKYELEQTQHPEPLRFKSNLGTDY